MFAGIREAGFPLNVTLAKGIALPVVLGVVWLGVHSVRTQITKRNRYAAEMRQKPDAER